MFSDYMGDVDTVTTNHNPARWSYVFDPENAMLCYAKQQTAEPGVAE